VAGTCGYGKGLSGSINAGNFLTSCKVYWLASQEGLCSMEQVSITACLDMSIWLRNHIQDKADIITDNLQRSYNST
jgi:hypothetical protein